MNDIKRSISFIKIQNKHGLTAFQCIFFTSAFIVIIKKYARKISCAGSITVQVFQKKIVPGTPHSSREHAGSKFGRVETWGNNVELT